MTNYKVIKIFIRWVIDSIRWVIDRIQTIQSIMTIIALIIGGAWALHLYKLERTSFPHANITQKIESFNLTDKIILLRISIDIENTGKSRMVLEKTFQYLQQILPLIGCPKEGKCAKKQINIAIERINIDEDRFSWPVISKREAKLNLEIEPGENEVIDFEFAIPSDIHLIRVYSYFENKQKKIEAKELGWATSSVYNLKNINENNNEY